MLKKIFAVTGLLLAFFSYQSVNADIIKYPGDELKKPIELCKKSPNPELSGEAMQALKHATQSVKCGQYEVAMEQAYYALEVIQELQQQAANAKGYCYHDRACKNLASGVKTTKKKCKALAGGKSWRQTHPVPAACVRI